MATLQSKYGTEKQSITITLTSFTTNTFNSSTAVDNTTNLFLDVLVQLQVKSAAAATSSTGYVNVYAYGTVDAADNLYPDGLSGTAATGVTLTSPPNLRLIGTINVVANSTTYVSEPFSVAAAFGGVLPEKWGIVVENQSGATLDATTGAAYYQGIEGQSV